MSSLHKFKLLASQCAATPTQSPSSSPVIHLRRRRKTLRMLLSRTPDRRRHDLSDLYKDLPDKKKKVRRKLKDLFVSSPPFDDEQKDDNVTADDDLELLTVGTNSVNGGGGGGGGESGSVGIGLNYWPRGGCMRPLSGTLRYRLLRKAWRPMLVTIPE